MWLSWIPKKLPTSGGPYRIVVCETNYGKRGASVKIKSGYQVRDRKNLALLETDWANEGIIRKETAQGTLYFMPR